MLEVIRAGKDEEGNWLDIVERPFGMDVEIRVIRRRRIPDILSGAYEKIGDVTSFWDIRPDLFRIQSQRS